VAGKIYVRRNAGMDRARELLKSRKIKYLGPSKVFAVRLKTLAERQRLHERESFRYNRISAGCTVSRP
jgi:hypothetical protein